MISDILNDLNWIDILMGCIVLRCIYIGATRGLVVEFFKLLGAFFATFINLHYCNKLAKFLESTLSIPPEVNRILGFVFLWLAVFVLFKIISEGWQLILKTEAHPVVNKWGGIVIAIPRAALVCSLTFTLIFISNNELLVRMSRSSLTGYYLIPLSSYIYEVVYEKIVVKLFPKEEENKKIIKLIKNEEEKKK